MPSGSRKRKAAKKKKGLESNSNKAPQINENDDLKHHDGKESEGEGEDDLANPQQQLTDEEDKGDVQSSGVENRSTEQTEQNGVPVQEAVPEDAVARDDLSEIVVEFNDRDNIAEHVGSEKEPEVRLLSKPVNEEVVVPSETESTEELNKIEHEKDSGEGGLLQGDAGESIVIDEPEAVVDDAPLASYGVASSLLSEVPSLENFGSIMESAPVEENSIDNASSSKDSFVPIKQGNDEKLEKETEALDQKSTSVLIHEDSGLGNKNDEVVGATPATVQETREMILTDITGSDEAANHANANNGSDHSKHLEVHESSINQPLLGSDAQPVQKASWLSCCGLLDAFAGPTR